VREASLEKPDFGGKGELPGGGGGGTRWCFRERRLIDGLLAFAGQARFFTSLTTGSFIFPTPLTGPQNVALCTQGGS